MESKIIQGDCLEVMQTLGIASVDAIVTDPPYLQTGTGGSRVSRSSVAAIPDERQFFDLWMREFWRACARVLKPTGALWMTLDWRGAVSCERAALGTPLSFGQVGVWDKGVIGMGYMLRRQYECFVVARMPDWQPTFRGEPDVWSERWTPSRRQTGHEAEKPIALIERAVRMIAPPTDGLVLDPFCGSGTTGVVAARSTLRFIGIERETIYVEMARQRIADVAPSLLDGAA